MHGRCPSMKLLNLAWIKSHIQAKCWYFDIRSCCFSLISSSSVALSRSEPKSSSASLLSMKSSSLSPTSTGNWYEIFSVSISSISSSAINLASVLSSSSFTENTRRRVTQLRFSIDKGKQLDLILKKASQSMNSKRWSFRSLTPTIISFCFNVYSHLHYLLKCPVLLSEQRHNIS